MEWFWLALTIGFLVVEIAITRLVAGSIAIGTGITSLVTALAPIPLYWQFILATLASLVFIFLVRPFIKKLMNKRQGK